MKKLIAILMLIGFLISVTSIHAYAESLIKVNVNGKKINMTINAKKAQGEILLPLKTIIDALGGKASVSGTTYTVIDESGKTKIIFKANNKQVQVNGNKISLKVSPIISQKTLLVPGKFLADKFGAKYEFDASKNIVTISKTEVKKESSKLKVQESDSSVKDKTEDKIENKKLIEDKPQESKPQEKNKPDESIKPNDIPENINKSSEQVIGFKMKMES